MKNLLVPTDFSPEAHYAYEVALRLAQHTGGTVTLLHMLEEMEDGAGGFSTIGAPVAGSGMDAIFPLKLIEATKRRIHALREEAPHLAAGVPVQEAIKVATISNGILTAIQKYNIDLVVMGARSHGDLEHFFVGSNAEHVIRRAPCPVLTVKRQQSGFEVSSIVFPFDFLHGEVSDLSGLRQVQAAFPNATLHLLQVAPGNTGQTATLQRQMQTFAEQHQLANCQTAVVNAARTSSGIEEYAESIHADLVVMPTHAHKGLAGFMHTSLAETVATHAAPPVLTYHLQQSPAQ